MDSEWIEFVRGVQEEKSVSNAAELLEMFRGEKFLTLCLERSTVQFLYEIRVYTNST
jgi:hypothetical protein